MKSKIDKKLFKYLFLVILSYIFVNELTVIDDANEVLGLNILIVIS